MNRYIGEPRDFNPDHAPVITDPDQYMRIHNLDSIPPGVRVEYNKAPDVLSRGVVSATVEVASIPQSAA